MTDSGQGRPRALVVDDEPEMAGFMAEVAELAGFATTVAADGRSALAQIESAPDVLILDLSMPDMDGVEVLRALASRQFKGRIILASGFDSSVLRSTADLAASMKLNIVGAIEKPVRAQALKALLEKNMQVRAAGPAGPAVTVDELRAALKDGQILLHYQPQVRIDDGTCVGVEALARWRHPERGMISPAQFIPLAESSGLALLLTYCVIERALRDWRDMPEDLRRRTGLLSINLPPAGLSDVNFPELAVKRIATYRQLIRNIQFEITETSVAEDPVLALDILTRLRLKGFTLSIDDFGTGHSSLGQLRSLPLNELKIDMSFVRGMGTDPKSATIVRNSIALGRELGLRVIAEGVEDAPLWHQLRDAGCEAAQGYFIAKPMPPADLSAWSGAWKAPQA
jgi:EAL domain-containing protein (putative c-di-GMP-specific phosphodiesterase class I)